MLFTRTQSSTLGPRCVISYSDLFTYLPSLRHSVLGDSSIIISSSSQCSLLLCCQNIGQELSIEIEQDYIVISGRYRGQECDAVIPYSYLDKISSILSIITIRISLRDKSDPLEVTTRYPIVNLCTPLEQQSSGYNYYYKYLIRTAQMVSYQIYTKTSFRSTLKSRKSLRRLISNKITLLQLSKVAKLLFIFLFFSLRLTIQEEVQESVMSHSHIVTVT